MYPAEDAGEGRISGMGGSDAEWEDIQLRTFGKEPVVDVSSRYASNERQGKDERDGLRHHCRELYERFGSEQGTCGTRRKWVIIGRKWVIAGITPEDVTRCGMQQGSEEYC